MRVSHSKMKTFQRCRHSYFFKYVMGIKKKRPAVQLKRGSWLHALLEAHYDGLDWRVVHAQLAGEFDELFEEEKEEYGDLPGECARIMTAYLARYRKEDAGLKVIDAEVDEVITLPNGDEFNFIIDLIVEESDGGIWLWDHKTVKEFMPDGFMLLDGQLTRYFAAAEQMGYRPLRGIVFNEIITRPPTPPSLLKSGKLTERANLKCDVYTYLAAIKEHGLDINDYRETLLRLKAQNGNWFRRTKLPKDKPVTETMMSEMDMIVRSMKEAEELEEFPRSPMKSCRWDCDYFDPCQISLQGGSIDSVIKMNYTTRSDREEDGNG